MSNRQSINRKTAMDIGRFVEGTSFKRPDGLLELAHPWTFEKIASNFNCSIGNVKSACEDWGLNFYKPNNRSNPVIVMQEKITDVLQRLSELEKWACTRGGFSLPSKGNSND